MSGDRAEIERIKAEMQRSARIAEQAKMVRAWLGSPEDRAAAAAELAGEPGSTERLTLGLATAVDHPEGPNPRHPMRPSGPKWDAIVHCYREWLARPSNVDARPDQGDIAAELRISPKTLSRWLDALGVDDWHDVHPLVMSEP